MCARALLTFKKVFWLMASALCRPRYRCQQVLDFLYHKGRKFFQKDRASSLDSNKDKHRLLNGHPEKGRGQIYDLGRRRRRRAKNGINDYPRGGKEIKCCLVANAVAISCMRRVGQQQKIFNEQLRPRYTRLCLMVFGFQASHLCFSAHPISKPDLSHPWPCACRQAPFFGLKGESRLIVKQTNTPLCLSLHHVLLSPGGKEKKEAERGAASQKKAAAERYFAIRNFSLFSLLSL